MNTTLPGASQNQNSTSRWSLAVVLTLLGVIAAWLNLPPGYLAMPEFRRIVGLAPAIAGGEDQAKTKPSRPEPPSRTVTPSSTPHNVSGSGERGGERPANELPYVGGFWRSHSRFGFTYIFTQSGSHFDIYQDDPVLGQVKIGSGAVTGSGVDATLQTIKEKRWVELKLQLSADGKTLEGTFSGSAQQEKNFPLTLSRVDSIGTK